MLNEYEFSEIKNQYYSIIKKALIKRFHSSKSENTKKCCKNLIKGRINLMNIKNYALARKDDSFYSNNDFLGNHCLKNLIKKGEYVFRECMEEILPFDEFKKLYYLCEKDYEKFKKKASEIAGRKKLRNPKSLAFLEKTLMELSQKDESKIILVEKNYNKLMEKIGNGMKESIAETLEIFYKIVGIKMFLNNEQYSEMKKLENILNAI